MDDLRNYQAKFQPPVTECRCVYTKGVGSASLPLPPALCIPSHRGGQGTNLEVLPDPSTKTLRIFLLRER